MKVAVGFDHRGVRLRESVLAAVADEGLEVVDLGVATDEKRVDYPDIARDVGMAIRSGKAGRGVLVCGSGVGASIAASKIPAIRAAICHDMNVLCLGSEIVGPSLASELVKRFLGASFRGEGRYLARLEKVEELERLVDG